MNVYLYEVRWYIKSVLIWSASTAALILMFMSFYPTFAADTQIVEQLLENYPEELLKAFGMNSTLPLSSVLGFFTFVFAFVQLCVAIQASNYGFYFLSVEERELTADFLMTKPASRTRIMAGKFLAAVTALTITNLVIWGSTFWSVSLFSDGNEYEVRNLVLLLVSTTPFQLFFMTVGMAISVVVKKVRSVLSFSMALAFGLYVLNALRAIVGGKSLGLISPFYHFDPGYILANGAFDVPMLIIDICVIAAAGVASYVLYLKRNILSV